MAVVTYFELLNQHLAGGTENTKGCFGQNCQSTGPISYINL
jgi:hypothetical protein